MMLNSNVLDASSKFSSLAIILLVFLLDILSFVNCQGQHIDTADSTYCSENSTHPVPCSDEAKLMRKILHTYKLHGTQSRPVIDSSKNVTVWYGMRLLYMDLDEKTQTLTISVWVRMRWYDELIKWNRSEYKPYSIEVPEESVWRPSTLTVTNTIFTKTDERKVKIRLKYDGRVLWFPQRQYKSECLMNIRNYPYDEHTCTLWVQSLAYPGSQVDLKPYYFNDNTPWDLDTYVVSQRLTQEWEIISNDTSRELVPRKSAILMYSRRVALKFTLTVRRRPGFISYLVRYPVIFLSFMGVLIFCLPVERPDRNMLAMSLFTSFMILLLILVESVPPSAAAIPKLVYLYCAELANVVVCIGCSVCVIHVSRRGETGYAPPPIVRKVFFGVLGKILFIHTGRLEGAGYAPANQSVERSPCLDTKPVMHSNDPEEGQSKPTNSSRQPLSKAGVDKQWKLVAFIMDRVFFFVFLISNILIVSLLFPTSE